MKFNRLSITTLIAVFALASFGAPAAAQSGDRHVGYYYPEPSSSEIYDARVPVLPGSDRVRRVGFVTVMTNEMLKNPYPPQFAIFAKGAEAEKLIITALNANSYDTLFRARGLFAMLTAVARGTPFFQEQPDADRFTFFDLAKLLGFNQITYTDGADFAHQIQLR